MKIAFLTPEYPHTSTRISGGIGTSIKTLASGLLANGSSVHVLVYGQDSDAVFEDNGVRIQKIKNVKFKGLSWFFTRKKIQKIIDTLYSNDQIDLVEAPDWTGITSFIKSKCPIVVRLHGSDTYFCHIDQRPVKWITRFHEKKAIQNADALLSVSRFTADMTNSVFDLKKEFTIIPNGIDLNAFEHNFDTDSVEKNTILYFGSLIRKKGLLELPLIFNKVIEKNPAARLILIGRDVPDSITGNPSIWKMMQSLFSEQAIKNVEYLGSVNHSEIRKHISSAAICVFPSFAEAFPMAWLEAMAMQKALVASDIGWATEMIDNANDGFLVNPKDHALYATTILRLLENKELQNAIGVEARKKVTQKFSLERIVQQNLEFYENIIKAVR